MNINDHLEAVLRSNELLWSKIIAINGTDQSDIIKTVSDIRAKLKISMDCAKSLFESNMQCVAHILCLKKELASLQNDFNSKIEVR